MFSFEEALQRFYFKLSAAAARFGLVAPPPQSLTGIPIIHAD